VTPGGTTFSALPFERLTVRDAVLRHTGIDLFAHADGESLAGAAQAIGVHVGTSRSFDDVFFHLFLERVERKLGVGRPTFLVEYPASMASLSRLKAEDPRVAERVELYVDGVELANGFSELNDPEDQAARFNEQASAKAAGDEEAMFYDADYVRALEYGMPPAAGCGVGVDRFIMLLTDAPSIRDVILFPHLRPEA
jgi:lysyl-tRNA synthetase class 2